MGPCVNEHPRPHDDPDVDQLTHIDEGQWGVGYESGGMGQDREDHAEVVEIADDVMSYVDFRTLGEDLDEVGLVEAPEYLQEDQEEGHEGRDFVSWKGQVSFNSWLRKKS